MSIAYKKLSYSDSYLWLRFKEGDRYAYGEIFQRYSDLLLNYGLNINDDRDLVKDCIQELFLFLWQKKENLSDVEAVKYYLIISLRRLILESKKTADKYAAAERSAAIGLSSGFNSSVEDTLVANETFALRQGQVNELLKMLPPRQKEAIFLRFYEKLEYEEIGKIMQLNYQVVRNTVYRAIKFLRTNFEKGIWLF